MNRLSHFCASFVLYLQAVLDHLPRARSFRVSKSGSSFTSQQNTSSPCRIMRKKSSKNLLGWMEGLSFKLVLDLRVTTPNQYDGVKG